MKPTFKPSQKSIKLLTYNVFLRPPPIKTNQDDYKNQRINDILEQIKHYDIVCFQEMFQTATFRKQYVIEKAIEKGFFYWKDCTAPSFFSGPPVDSGLLVISRYPILSSHFQSYNCGVLSDSASDKGYIYCQIQIQNKILHLFTTHLQASYLHPGMLLQRQLSIKTRLYQFRHLLKRINQHINSYQNLENDGLIILMGDLNMNALMLPYHLHQNTVLESQKVGVQFHQLASFNKIFNDYKIKAINCGYQKYKKHPITFGDGDKILTDQLETISKQSLDYIYCLEVQKKQRQRQKSTSSIHKRSIKNNKKKITQITSSKNILQKQIVEQIKPIISSTQVQQFKIKDRKYTQLSDHYGMSIVLQV